MKISYPNIYWFEQIQSLRDDLDIIRYGSNKDICVGITGMYANPIHGGHIDLIKHARYHCDVLIVAVNNDECSVLKSGYSFMPIEDRMKIISSLADVDFVIENPSVTMVDLLDSIKVEKYFKGGDVSEINLLPEEKESCKQNNIQIIYNTGGKKTSSSSYLLKKYGEYYVRNIV